jgi:hypothetical protein
MMRELRKKGPLRTMLVGFLCFSFLWLVYPKNSVAGSGVDAGSETSEEAGAPSLQTLQDLKFSLGGWKPTLAFLHGSAAADTTDLEFPEEEEEDTKHVFRDVGIFIVVSAFLAFFLVKVFIEGDEEEAPPEDNGKEIPPTSRITPKGQRAW